MDINLLSSTTSINTIRFTLSLKQNKKYSKDAYIIVNKSFYDYKSA